MIRKPKIRNHARALRVCGALSLLALGAQAPAAESKIPEASTPGAVIEISFPEAGLPPTLYSMMHGTTAPAGLSVHLPDDYSRTNTFPLLVYVPGNDGGTKGNLDNARTIVGPRGWIAASLPLFKKAIDRSEPGGGVIVSFEDYGVLSQAYHAMLSRLFEQVPNIDPEKSAMVGFSNGAITIGVLVSNHDEFILTHFRNFCLVDHGMFHLADLHKSRARDARFLILVGDREDMGRDLKIRQSRLQQDAWRLLGADLTSQIMKDTGHEFNAPQMELVGEWLQDHVARDTEPKS